MMRAAINTAPTPAQATEPRWISIIAVSYICDHPEGYRSHITPMPSGGFKAWVELVGLVCTYAPDLFASLSQAQAWCADGQRYLDLTNLS